MLTSIIQNFITDMPTSLIELKLYKLNTIDDLMEFIYIILN